MKMGTIIRRLPPSAGAPEAANDPELHYLLACFSQLAYVYIPAYEVQGCRGTKVVPSELFTRLARRGRSVDVAAFLTRLFPEEEFAVDMVATSNSVTIVASIRDVVIIASRGTIAFGDRYFRPFHDWWVDLKAWRAPIDFIGASPERYHSGFFLEAMTALPTIQAAHQKHGAKPNIYFTGHSLGGGISAVLDRFWRTSSPQEKRQTLVFGCPRFGNRDAVARRPILSYGRQGDPVPQLPPRVLGYADIENFRSIGGEFSPLLRWRNHFMERYRRSMARRCALEMEDEDFFRLLGISLMAAP
jgi:predicted lipase